MHTRIMGFLPVVVLACGSGCGNPSAPHTTPASSGSVGRGLFVAEEQMLAARKAEREKGEPCTKWCGGPIASASSNPQKPGCSEARCKELFPVGKKFFHRCVGADCTDCKAVANTPYSVDCPDTPSGTLDGCLITFASMSTCE